MDGLQLNQLHLPWTPVAILNSICVFITQTNPNDVDISEDEFLTAWDRNDEVAK